MNSTYQLSRMGLAHARKFPYEAIIDVAPHEMELYEGSRQAANIVAWMKEFCAVAHPGEIHLMEISPTTDESKFHVWCKYRDMAIACRLRWSGVNE